MKKILLEAEMASKDAQKWAKIFPDFQGEKYFFNGNILNISIKIIVRGYGPNNKTACTQCGASGCSFCNHEGYNRQYAEPLIFIKGANGRMIPVASPIKGFLDLKIFEVQKNFNFHPLMWVKVLKFFGMVKPYQKRKSCALEEAQRKGREEVLSQLGIC